MIAARELSGRRALQAHSPGSMPRRAFLRSGCLRAVIRSQRFPPLKRSQRPMSVGLPDRIIESALIATRLFDALVTPLRPSRRSASDGRGLSVDDCSQSRLVGARKNYQPTGEQYQEAKANLFSWLYRGRVGEAAPTVKLVDRRRLDLFEQSDDTCLADAVFPYEHVRLGRIANRERSCFSRERAPKKPKPPRRRG